MCTSDEPEEPDPSRRFKMVVEAAYQGKTASPGFAEHGPIRVAFSADGAPTIAIPPLPRDPLPRVPCPLSSGSYCCGQG